MTGSYAYLISALWGILVCAGPGTAASAADAAPQEWRGAWVLERDLGASAVSALSSVQTQALLGTRLSLTDRASSPGGGACTSPKFQVSQESLEAITREFRVKLPELQARGPLSILEVGCENEGYTLVRLDAKAVLLIYRGHVFLAEKVSGG
jgi:hypothetical protein